ncbi:MAG: isocitrate/isopropylmalate family dehydrogenase, partial [Candidatus Dormibacteraceae bacterium]
MTQQIAVIAGDGVGREVIPAGIRILTHLRPDLDFEEFGWGSERYLETGAMMPADALEVLQRHDAIYLGAIGWPTVPDHVSLWGCLMP